MALDTHTDDLLRSVTNVEHEKRVAIELRRVHIVELLVWHAGPRHSAQGSREIGSRSQSNNRIDSRLANIEQLLRQTANGTSASSTQPTPASSHTSTSDVDRTSNPAGSHPQGDSSAQMRGTGDLGLWSESKTAKAVLEQIVGRDLAVQRDPQLLSALESLRGIVHRSQNDLMGQSKASGMNAMAESALESPIPGWAEIKGLLERAEKIRPVTFLLLSPAVFDDFCRKCRAMYEKGQEGSHADRLLVYGSMSNLCSQFSGTTDDDEAAAYHHSLAKSFFKLSLQTLATFPMFTPASVETIEALLVAGLVTNGMCKPSLAWSLSCAAAQMCQALGFNRMSQHHPSSDPMYNRKVMLFWCIYVMDRNNSLRLGHSPAIPDYDIDTPMIAANNDTPVAAQAMMRFWIDCGRIQGEIRTKLYGPTASSLGADERARIAEAFADELEGIHQRKTEANVDILPLTSRGMRGNVAELWLYGDDIMHFSTLTTALSAIPVNHPRRFRAIEAARECLRICRRISKTHRDNLHNWATFCHWVLLRVPLTSFTGVFYNVIANPRTSQEDLSLLEDFAAVFEPARRLSDGIDKFYQLCAIFVEVARAYVRAKAQPPSTTDRESGHSMPSRVLQSGTSDRNEVSSISGSSNKGHLVASGNAIDLSAGTDLNDVPIGTFEPHEQLFDATTLPEWYDGNVSFYGLLEGLDEMDEVGFSFFGDGMDVG